LGLRRRICFAGTAGDRQSDGQAQKYRSRITPLPVCAAPVPLLSPFLRCRFRSAKSREFFGPTRWPTPILVVLVRTRTGHTGAALRQRKMRCFIGEEPDSPKRSGRVTTGRSGHDGDCVPPDSVETRARFWPRFLFLPRMQFCHTNARLGLSSIASNPAPTD
jgi:hypothetical protein